MNEDNSIKKEITSDDLAAIMRDGFIKSEKSTDKKIDDLASMVQNEFTELKTEFKSDTKLLIEEIREVKNDTEEIKAELNKKVDKFEHKDLEYRVEKLEKKFA